VSVSVETSTGLAISNVNGLTFQKVGQGPVFTNSPDEPFLVGDSFVRFYNGVYHMWYMFGTRWIDTLEEGVQRVYKIGHATSKDGINWIKEESKQIIPDFLNPDECQALPSILFHNNRYHMYFCYREATGFRKDKTRGYRLGYAYSDDLINWMRDEANVGIKYSDEGWDSDMMCYPHIFKCDKKVYLLYNGNEFGRYGFGIATLEE
jgi:sucrose-6-phosphate hydrolase SacC (GH32 family)